MALFGLESREELDQLDVSDLLVDPQDRRRQTELLDQAGEVREFELSIRTRDGDVKTVLDSFYRLRDEETGEWLYHGVLVDISDRKKLEERLHTHSIRDPLTGCFNRRYLNRLAGRLDPSETSWGVVFVDIDHFKRYNDEHGHAAGDEALVRVARALERHLRVDDAVIRFGGDEFVVLLTGEGEQQTRLVARRLSREASESDIPSFSLGSAARRDGESLEETIRRADEKLLARRGERRERG